MAIVLSLLAVASDATSTRGTNSPTTSTGVSSEDSSKLPNLGGESSFASCAKTSEEVQLGDTPNNALNESLPPTNNEYSRYSGTMESFAAASTLNAGSDIVYDQSNIPSQTTASSDVTIGEDDHISEHQLQFGTPQLVEDHNDHVASPSAINSSQEDSEYLNQSNSPSLQNPQAMDPSSIDEVQRIRSHDFEAPSESPHADISQAVDSSPDLSDPSDQPAHRGDEESSEPAAAETPQSVDSSPLSSQGQSVPMATDASPLDENNENAEGEEWEALDDVELSLSDIAPSTSREPYVDEDAVGESDLPTVRGVSAVGKKTLKKQAFSTKESGSILDAYETKPASIPAPAEETPAVATAKPAARSLRPGGVKNSPVLSVSVEAERKGSSVNWVYSKEIILSLCPKRFGERPSCMACYDNLSGQGGGQDHRRQRHGDDSRPSRHAPTHQDEWKRVKEPVSRRRKEPAGPMPKRQITDPAEIISRQVQDILNKITPQTFEKLTAKLCDIPMNTNEHLSLMVNKVFEKAIQEPNFSHLYAELCKNLEERSASWAFVQVVYIKDANQFIWIRDIPMNDEFFAGPFHSIKDCLSCAESVNTPEPVKPPGALEIHKLIAIGNMLVKVSMRLIVNCFFECW